MGRQFIAVGVGMGVMARSECRFCLRMVRCVGPGVIHGVVLFPFNIAFLVLALM